MWPRLTVANAKHDQAEEHDSLRVALMEYMDDSAPPSHSVLVDILEFSGATERDVVENCSIPPTPRIRSWCPERPASIPMVCESRSKLFQEAHRHCAGIRAGASHACGKAKDDRR